jgi:hypothetical protein
MDGTHDDSHPFFINSEVLGFLSHMSTVLWSMNALAKVQISATEPHRSRQVCASYFSDLFIHWAPID